MTIEDLKELTNEQKAFIEKLGIKEVKKLVPLAILFSEDEKNPLPISHPLIRAAFEAPFSAETSHMGSWPGAIYARLDEVVGKGNWSCELISPAGTTTHYICNLTILGVTKANAGCTPSAAFSFAALMFGIGRYCPTSEIASDVFIPTTLSGWQEKDMHRDIKQYEQRRKDRADDIESAKDNSDTETKEVVEESAEKPEKSKRGRKPKVVEQEPEAEEIADTSDKPSDSDESNDSIESDESIESEDTDESDESLDESLDDPFAIAATQSTSEKKHIDTKPEKEDIVSEVEEHLAKEKAKPATKTESSSSNICLHCRKIIPASALEEIRAAGKPLLHPKCVDKYEDN